MLSTVNSACRMQFVNSSNCFSFSTILSFMSLICNAKLDANSSCLDRQNNFVPISSQKLQNFPQNAIGIITGTLMCKSG